MIAQLRNTSGITSYLTIAIVAMLVGFGVSYSGMIVPGLLVALALFAGFLTLLVKDIRWGFYILMVANFFSVGLTRYIDLPLGLLIDFILLLIAITFFIINFKSISWKPLRNPVFLMVSGWMLFNILQIVNPEARSFEAWFYAMRGVALYFILTLMMGYLILNHQRDFKWFIFLWLLFSVVGAFWGMKQLFYGLDEGEKAWLNVPGNLTTHLLFGKLRVFSFYSDAGQFGAAQAHAGVVALALGIFQKKWSARILLLSVSLICFYGMLISGTRGAFAIPVVGIFTLLLLIRKFSIVIVGTLIMVSLLFVLKFTFIGQGNYQIQRLRSALDPNDASLQVRLANQKKLASYLDHHLLGGGVGSGGYWGQRFSPNSFLANLALDSWYVRIAAEYGYIGLFFYLTMIFLILYQSLKNINRQIDPDLKFKLIALFAGLAGVLVASYGNQVFGQMPTGVLMYLSIVFLTKKELSNENNYAKNVS